MRKKIIICFVLAFFIVIIVLAYTTFSNNKSQPKQAQNNSGQDTELPTPLNASLPVTCVDKLPDGIPVITSLSEYSGSIGTKIEISGCNFQGFEGDKNAWIENSQGKKGILYGQPGSTEKLLKVTLKSPLCQKDNSYSGLQCDAYLNLTPGNYKIFTAPWTTKSNEAVFTIK